MYSATLEQCRSLATALQRAAVRIEKKAAETERGLIKAVLTEVELAVGPNFGGRPCQVRVGLLKDKDTLAYDDELVQRDDSVSFQCLDEERTIRETDELVIPVRGMGVLEVRGFCKAAPPLRTQERPDVFCSDNKRLGPYLDAKKRKDDETLKSRIDLWRRPDHQSSGSVLKEPLNRVLASVVKGHVTDVDRQRGDRYVMYTIAWEDSLVETEVSARLMKDLVKVAPFTLGAVPKSSTHLAVCHGFN